MKILFFDISSELISTYQKYLSNINGLETFFILDRIENIINKYKLDALISPANSFGMMNGGIDKNYTELFSEIEKTVKSGINVAKLGKSWDGTYYLPVGQNIVVPINHDYCKFMIVMPTMYMPSNIKDTNNVYSTFYGFLTHFYIQDIIVGCPGLGTGVGCLSSLESCKQIMQAIIDFKKNNPNL